MNVKHAEKVLASKCSTFRKDQSCHECKAVPEGVRCSIREGVYMDIKGPSSSLNYRPPEPPPPIRKIKEGVERFPGDTQSRDFWLMILRLIAIIGFAGWLFVVSGKW
jgi:hypothetical protein